ncbi:MAG: tetratricopeptide repeat protein [Planctomycetota bacterium]|nr:tetratricopeptide repeat protein [Planctomycetota bacterium]
MASRANMKFLVILSAVLLVLLSGAVVAAYSVLSGRAQRWVTKGDALAAAGDYQQAAKLYERAVGKDNNNLEWLQKWKDTLLKVTPDNRARYENEYTFYRNILRKIAVLRASDPQAQLDYVSEIDRFVRAATLSRQGLELIIAEATERLRDLDPDDPITKKVAAIRGAAQADRMTLLTVEEEDRNQALKDLESAIAANPADLTSRIAQIRWYLSEAERFRGDRRPDLEEAPRLKARELTDKLIADMPDSPEAALAAFAANQSDRLRIVQNNEERLKIIESLNADAMKLVDITLAADPAKVPTEHVERLVATVIRVAGKEAIPGLTAVVERALQNRPTDAGLMMNKGVLLQQGGKLEEAIAQFQKVIDLPDLPVSLEGLVLPSQRMSAMAFQIDCAISQWNDADTDEARAAALTRAKAYREQLYQLAGVRGKEQLLLRDAKIAFAEKRYDETVARLSELRDSSRGTDAGARSLEVLQILAQALVAQGNYGEARLVLQEMRDAAPTLAWTNATLGEVYIRMGRFEDALQSYQAALKVDADNAQYQERVSSIRAMMSGGTEGDATLDPIVAGVIGARKMRDEGNLAGARDRIEALLKSHPEDRRLINEIVQLDIREGRREDAIARLEALQKKAPDDQFVKQALTQLKIKDPVEAALTIVEQSDLPPGIKELERFNVFLQAGRTEEAQKALSEAERLAPDDPRVIDMAFVVALNRRDYTKAQAIAQQAAKLDVDQLGGLLYQGRLELVEGADRPEKLAAAVSTFETAVKRVPFNPTARKLLAQSYKAAGRLPEAIEAFKRSYEGKPDDVSIARDYAEVLIQSNRGAEALKVISPEEGILRFHPANRELVALWMGLEAQYGDRGRALAARKEMATADPQNGPNLAALAQLLTLEKKFDEANAALEQLSKVEGINPLVVASLRAETLSAQGDIDGGAKAFQDYIAKGLDPAASTTAYLAYADYLRKRNRVEEAMAAMRQAQQTQDPTLRQADRALGDLNFDIGTNLSQQSATAEGVEAADVQGLGQKLREQANSALAEAVKHYEEVLKVTTDPAQLSILRKRMSEVYLRLQRYDDASRLVSELARTEPDDLQVLLLQGAIAAGKDDRRAARQYYDRAVTANPSNPNSYFQRALFNMDAKEKSVRDSLVPDILQDLEQVTKLRPAQVTAWTQRYSLLRELGRNDQATATLRSAVDANPTNDDLRFALVKDLAMNGKIAEMQTELLRTVEARPTETKWLRMGANFLGQRGIDRYKEAADLLERYYKAEPDPVNGVVLLDMLLRPGVNPDRRRVQQLIPEIDKTIADAQQKAAAAPESERWRYERDPLFDVMLRARARAYTGQEDLSEKHLSEAMSIVGGSSERSMRFMDQLTTLKGGKPEEAVRWLQTRAKSGGGLSPFLQTIVISSRRGVDPAALLEGELNKLLAQDLDETARIEVYRALSTSQYANKAFKESVDSARKAIELMEAQPNGTANPAYLEMANNLAYTLVAQLGDPTTGLPYAEKAAALRPNSSTILDTLGWTHYKLKNYAKAVEILTRAVETARDPEERFVGNLHLGLAQLAADDKSSARRSLREAISASDSARSDELDDYKEQLDSLRKALE